MILAAKAQPDAQTRLIADTLCRRRLLAEKIKTALPAVDTTREDQLVAHRAELQLLVAQRRQHRLDSPGLQKHPGTCLAQI